MTIHSMSDRTDSTPSRKGTVGLALAAGAVPIDY